MTGMTGWVRAPLRPGGPEAGIAITEPNAAPEESGLMSQEDGLHIAVPGHIAWSDPELRQLAEQRGQRAALAQAYRRHGARLTALLGGQFALALIDPARPFVLLATDRMGTQPMCYARVGADGFVFASSAQSVRRHAGVQARVSAQALYDYVYFHMIPSPRTVYAGIDKLERGSELVFESGTVSTRGWWTPRFDEYGDSPLDELARDLQSALREAVRACRPDAQTASFLSGGLDSSTVCGYHREVSGHRTPAYTIGFGAEGYDEMRYARIAARHFDLDLREHYVTPDDIAGSMRDIARAYDEPFGNSSAVPTLACARRAHADGVRVMLAGDGGDEIFAGNDRYARQTLFEHYWRLPATVRTALIEPLILGLPVTAWTPPTRKLRSYVAQARVPMPARLATYNFIQRMTPQALFEPAFLARVDVGQPPAMLDASYGAAPAQTLVNRMMYLDWKITLADNDLRKVSRMCELAGIEVRYPMLDDALIDLSLRVPARLKLKGRTLRWFYKQALTGFLPREIIEKTKHGFGLPFGVWLASSPPLQSLVYGSLDALKQRAILRPEFIDQLLASQRDEHAAYYGDLVWVLSMLELWLSEHGVGLDPS
jgi:asparagine synthase (glutamine-hydrolysing)